MKTILRFLILIMALGMYYILFKSSEYTFRLMLQIISIGLLLIGMESMRRKGEKLYHQNSDIEVIDEMNENSFREYIAQIYKKSGYYIQPNKNPKKMEYDFIIIKDKKIRVIKCFKTSEPVTLDQVTQAYEFMQKVNKKNGLFVTNQAFDQEAVEYLADKQVQVVERRELIDLVEQTVNNKYLSQKTKVQET